MSWTINLRPDGIFDASNEIGHPVFSGTFPPEIALPVRLRMLNVIAEAESMLDMLRGILAEVDGLIYGIEQEHGREVAAEQGVGLYQMRKLIADQIKRAEGLEE